MCTRKFVAEQIMFDELYLGPNLVIMGYFYVYMHLYMSQGSLWHRHRHSYPQHGCGAAMILINMNSIDFQCHIYAFVYATGLILREMTCTVVEHIIRWPNMQSNLNFVERHGRSYCYVCTCVRLCVWVCMCACVYIWHRNYHLKT